MCLSWCACYTPCDRTGPDLLPGALCNILWVCE